MGIRGVYEGFRRGLGGNMDSIRCVQRGNLVAARLVPNPKPEIRRPKEGRRPNTETTGSRGRLATPSQSQEANLNCSCSLCSQGAKEVGNFGFRNSAFFRVSAFGFRISPFSPSCVVKIAQPFATRCAGQTGGCPAVHRTSPARSRGGHSGGLRPASMPVSRRAIACRESG